MTPSDEGRRAPIAVFAYNRREHLESMLQSLTKCYGFDESPVTIFIDGPRNEADQYAVQQVRDFVKGLDYPNVTSEIADENLGLRRSISSGVTRLVEEYGQVIVLEDDLILSPIALDYFNAALKRYKDDNRIWSISGYISHVPELLDYHRALILPLAHSWGWATWARAWKNFDLDAQPSQKNLESDSFQTAFDMDGFYPYRMMLRLSNAGLVNSWYVHWLYTIFKHGGRSVFPPRRVLDNYGISKGTHGGGLNPHEKLVSRPGLLTNLPKFGDASEVDYFAIDLLRNCWEARVQRGIAFAGSIKRQVKRLLRIA